MGGQRYHGHPQARSVEIVMLSGEKAVADPGGGAKGRAKGGAKGRAKGVMPPPL